MKSPKLPSISRVKKALYADWALRVKQRDGWKCLLCGCEDNLTAHHWYVSDHHAHAARYSLDNGATLCYACHIRGVHQRADYMSVSDVANAVFEKTEGDVMSRIDTLADMELTTSVLRTLWAGMRARTVTLGTDYITHAVKRGSKWFLTVDCPHPVAVVGNTIRELAGHGVMEVTAIAKTEDGYRYTLKPMEAE